MFGGSENQRFEIELRSAVSGMADYIHPGILNGIYDSLSILFPASAFEAAGVYAGNPDVHSFIV